MIGLIKELTSGRKLMIKVKTFSLKKDTKMKGNRDGIQQMR
jgi:hypothetical protein